MTTSKNCGGHDDIAQALSGFVATPASITREAVETLAQQQGKSVLDLLTALQGASTLPDDDELTLNALCAIKNEILTEQGLLPPGPRFPNVTVRLVGQDGNIFNIIGLVCRALRKHGATPDEVKAFTDEVTASESYDKALAVVMGWVEVS